MNTKHTPGPWLAIGYGTKVVQLSPADLNKAHDQFPAIVDTTSGHDLMPYEEACSNARLIAAAPDLLAALNGVLDMLSDNQLQSVAGERARAAIAKATEVQS